ncbi:MAG: sulfide:quinone reductase [Opitutia bacterium Tous-C1TDCM]|nr:MAG: sulfide:quinone reductase [Opitutae bacterium Tous-C1TDCM]
MAKIVILGAGVAGHTAATLLRRQLGREHDVTVISPEAEWNWIPSNIWVGVGVMERREVVFPLAPLYAQMDIAFRPGRAAALFPEGTATDSRSFVTYLPAGAAPGADPQREYYDFLVNATGPKLNFAATKGLGPHGGHSVSVCTADHAVDAARAFRESIARLRHGERQTFVVGMGHGTCTCEGAAFEYVFNVEHELRRHGVRDRARVLYVSNEPELGDFGLGGLHLKRGGYVVPARLFTESLFVERGVEWLHRAHVREVAAGRLACETADGREHEVAFDFAMLLPPFRGAGLAVHDRQGADISDRVFTPGGFMRVDADYTDRPFEAWHPRDWPSTYQSPAYPNLFAAGIAFAPPHAVSRPLRSPQGTLIAPAVPRTGMTAGIMGRTVALSIAHRVRHGPAAPLRRAPFATMGAACVASAGTGFTRGSAATLTLYPVVPDFDRYEFGRDLRFTTAEIGLAGHWLKHLLHHLFLYKAKCRPFWWLIPE